MFNCPHVEIQSLIGMVNKGIHSVDADFWTAGLAMLKLVGCLRGAECRESKRGRMSVLAKVELCAFYKASISLLW